MITAIVAVTSMGINFYSGPVEAQLPTDFPCINNCTCVDFEDLFGSRPQKKEGEYEIINRSE
jgi:hypothetical protein